MDGIAKRSGLVAGGAIGDEEGVVCKEWVGSVFGGEDGEDTANGNDGPGDVGSEGH